MNYHKWAKTSHPEQNIYSPAITYSTCVYCKNDFERDFNRSDGSFNPLRCQKCEMVGRMARDSIKY